MGQLTCEAKMTTNVANKASIAIADAVMSLPLANLLFKEYRRKVLGLLLTRPDQAYHVREIARLTGTLPGTLHKELSRLAEAGILSKQVIGNQVSYQANRQCLIFHELAAILRKTSGLVDLLADALAPLNDKLQLAFVFGSMASDKAHAGSDVDLLVVGEVDFGEVVKALYPVQEMLGREINPKIYSEKEWRRVLMKNEAFIKEVMERPKLFVVGSANDLG